MKVFKFGGSSVANATNIKKVATIVSDAAKSGPLVVVVSALGGVTDRLIGTGRLAEAHDDTFIESIHSIEQIHINAVTDLLPATSQDSIISLVRQKCAELHAICNGVYLLSELSVRTLDSIMGYGELLSSLIVSATLQDQNIDNQWIDSRELIKTNSNFGSASVAFDKTNQLITSRLGSSKHMLSVLPGFIASDEHTITTTLGRGGSDYTAAIVAAALQADSLEIWTDVSGMMTADPRLVSSAKVIPHISYQEAMELTHFGAKVIYPPTLQPVMNKNIKVVVKNTFKPDHPGTVIESTGNEKNSSVRGISSIGNIALMSLEGSGMVGVPGISSRLFKALSAERINVILITQGSSEHSICFAINDSDAAKAKSAVDSTFEFEINSHKIEPLKLEANQTIIALVGDNMRSHPGISGKMFGALGRNGVNIRAIAQGSSEKNISAVVNSSDLKKALNVLHEEFFESEFKQLNLFIVGVGNVGSRLIDQLHRQQQYLAEQLRLQIRVAGLANSRKMIFDEKGIDISSWKELLLMGESMDIGAFTNHILDTNLRNSVFVDVTANEKVAAVYGKLLSKSISVVACNKIASSSKFENYQQLKRLAREFNALFLFETNVGAGLPVIGTLNDLTRSGDRLHKLEAVLSGTLNFVFNHYDATETFAKIVKRAQNEGYTEPDPRIDLSGIDVMRKVLILARESGLPLELEQISNTSFLPESCMNGNVEDFYAELGKHEEYFARLFSDALAKNCKLRFVATLENGKASVGLQHVPAGHNLYNLQGKDNIVLFYTERYADQPLVVKGAGAGAEVTASGIFADVMRTARI